jgi:hypothetical protein
MVLATQAVWRTDCTANVMRVAAFEAPSAPCVRIFVSAQSQRPTFKVRVYAQLGGKNRSSGGGTGCVGSGSGGSYTCNSADSNVVARTPQQVRGALVSLVSVHVLGHKEEPCLRPWARFRQERGNYVGAWGRC